MTVKSILVLIGLIAVVTASAAGEVEIVDGDTLIVDGIHYRLNGIDAPEAGQDCMTGDGHQWDCGREATRHLKGMIRDTTPHCVSLGVDDYDRVIATCDVDGHELNRQMVEDGLAWAFVKYSTAYAGVELTARERASGIWQAATEAPWDYRARRWDVAKQTAPLGCPIKGNISDGGRIYHAPWSPWYDRTKVSVEDGERWFCSEREALDAGWRPPVWGR